jgi:hypothetical protein
VGLLGGCSSLNPNEKPRHHLASWDLKTGKLVQHLPIAQTEGVSLASGAIAPDTRTLVSKGALIDLATGKQLPHLEGAEGASDPPYAFSFDSALVAGGGRQMWDRRFADGISVWEAVTGKKIAHLHTRWLVAQLAFHPSGRFVAGNDLGGIRIWDLSTGKLMAALPPPEKVQSTLTGGYSSCLAFSPDGRTLATGQPDGTILLWNVAAAAASSAVSTPKELEQLWADLLEADASKAWRAVWRLRDSPETALVLLRQRLQPRPPAPDNVTAPLLGDLSSDSFQRRDRAAKQLKDLGYAAEPALRDVLKTSTSLEQKRRIDQILSDLRPTALELREVRALRLLSGMHTSNARRLLHELANGPESATLTRQARALCCSQPSR